MASRKKLSPVSSPVDPFVTPASPGPAQSDQSWQGLLSLSNSLMQADAAYREADEKRTREARVKAAEERRAKAQAEDDAAIASEIFSTPEGQDLIKKLNAGEASEEDMLKGQEMLKSRGVASEFNPILIGAMERYGVTTLADTNQYLNYLSNPEALASLSGKAPQEQQNIRDQLKAQWVADQDVKDSLLPVLMESLRSYDAQLNTIYGNARKTQHDAKTEAFIVNAVGGVVTAITDGDADTGTPEEMKRWSSIWKHLSTEDKTATSAQIEGTLGARFQAAISREEMSGSDADAVLESMTPFLTERQISNLENTITRAANQQAAQAGANKYKRAETEKGIQDRITTIIYNAQIKGDKEGSPLTKEAGMALITGQYEDIGKQLAAAGFSKNGAARLVREARESFEDQFSRPIVADPELLSSLRTGVTSLDPEALANVEQAFISKLISQPDYQRLTTLADGLAEKNTGSSYVTTMANNIHFPAGVTLKGEVMQAGVKAFEAHRGKDRDVIRNAVFNAMVTEVAAKKKDTRTASTDYLLGARSQGNMNGLATTIKEFVQGNSKLQDYYSGSEGDRDSYLDVFNYIFNRMSDTQKVAHENLTKDAQERQLGSLVGNIIREPQAFIDSMDKKMRAAQDVTEKETQAGPGVKSDAAIEKLYAVRNRKSKLDVAAHWSHLDSFFTYTSTPEQRVVANMREMTNDDKDHSTLTGRMPLTFSFARSRWNDPDPQKRVSPLTKSGTFKPYLMATTINKKLLALGRSLTRELGIANTLGMPVEMTDFPSEKPIKASDYIQAHFLHYGMPLTAFIKGKHLGVEVQREEFAFDSAPFFSSREDLDAAMGRDADSQEFVASDEVKEAFKIFGLGLNAENLSVFYQAQAKLTAKTPFEQTFIKAMHSPDFSGLQNEADQKAGTLTFLNGSTDLWSGDAKPNVILMKSFTDKIGGN